MPYLEKLSLVGATPDALASEVYGLLDGALEAHPVWEKVGVFRSHPQCQEMGIWRNNGTGRDGYPWFLLLANGASSTSLYQGRVLLGAALESDYPARPVMRKALRGNNTPGFVDADGYPLVAAGGAEMEFPLDKFLVTNSGSVGALGGGFGTSQPAAPATGNWLRALVTDQLVWFGYGTQSKAVGAQGCGTYQNLHSTVADQRPLAFQGVMGTSSSLITTTVWQHPDATERDTSRGNVQHGSTYHFMYGIASVTVGQVAGRADMLYGGPVGSRLGVQRFGYINKYSGTNEKVDLAGGFLGVAPFDLLVFGRDPSCMIGDTIQVGSKVYVSVDSPSAYPSLFVNTQPDN